MGGIKKMNATLKCIISPMIWALGIILAAPYEIPGNLKNQITIGMLIVVAGLIPQIIDYIHITFKKSERPSG